MITGKTILCLALTAATMTCIFFEFTAWAVFFAVLLVLA